MVLPEIISKEPLGPVVRQGDDQWFNIVKWVLLRDA
jgi:general L-amino acid transport system substrate-binding protein